MVLRRMRVLLGLMFIAALLVGSCSASADGELQAELEQRVAELEAENGDLEARLAIAESAAASAQSTIAQPETTTTQRATTTTQTPTADLDGYFDLVDNRNWKPEGDGCVGEGAYADLSEVFQITLVSDAGITRGVVSLGIGEPHEAGELGTDHGATFCRFSFVFGDVPLDSEFFTVVTRRGDVVFETEQALQDLSLVIGETP